MTSSHHQPCLSLIRFLVGVTSVSTCSVLLAADESTMSLIERAWRERQDKTISFRLRWKQSRVLKTGHDPSNPFGADSTTSAYVAHDYEQLLAVQDGKYRFFSSEPAKNAQTGDWMRKESTDVSNGVTAKNFTKRDTSYLPLSGSDSKHKPLEESIVFTMSDLRPVTLHFRPFLLSPPVLAGFTVSKERGEADGKPCLIIRRLVPSQPTVTEALWVDPKQQYSVRRRTQEYQGKVFYQLDVQYRLDTAGSVPTGWHEDMYYAGDGTLTKSLQGTVVSSEININLPESEFELAFPPGTKVRDGT